MSTFFGMGVFSLMAALILEKIYGSIVHSTSAAAEAGRYAVFTGTWTTLGTASAARGMRNMASRWKGRAKSARRAIDKQKDV